MIHYIDQHRGKYGVEPICQVLEIAPSTYYEARSRSTSARRLRDAELKVEIEHVRKENFEVYVIEKVWRQLNREGIAVGRERVARLSVRWAWQGRSGASRSGPLFPASRPKGRPIWSTCKFTAPAPNRLWVADLTYVWTRAGFVYVAFVIDVFSRSIVGWRVSSSLHAELALDALEMALWHRGQQQLEGLIHHSDQGVQPGFNGSSQHREVQRIVSGH